MRIFSGDKCWDCPPGTPLPPSKIALRSCQWCGKKNCPLHGFFDTAKLRDSHWSLVCICCEENPSSFDQKIESRLRELLCKSVKRCSIDVDRFSTAQINPHDIDWDALQKFANFVYDLSQAAQQKVAQSSRACELF